MQVIIPTFPGFVILYADAISATDEEALVRNVALLTLIPFTLAFAFIVFVLYRERREATFREKQAVMKRKVAEVEMKALRAQMNPHFMFNCLNSINNFISVNQTEVASAYLIKFSNLIRMVLENSEYREIPLKDDLDALDLYIQMERMRLGNGFDYSIVVDPSVNSSIVMVPPLILQPFVENSIWHGLSKRKNDGILSIFITRHQNMLKLIIDDNGIKNKTESEQPVNPNKKKSLGMSLTHERLHILNEYKNVKAELHSTDKTNDAGEYTGKNIELFLPLEEPT